MEEEGGSGLRKQGCAGTSALASKKGDEGHRPCTVDDEGRAVLERVERRSLRMCTVRSRIARVISCS